MSRVDLDEQIMQSFEVSNNAARSINYHVHELAKEHLQVGVKKSAYIKDHKADYLKAQGRPENSKLTISDKGQITQLHSWHEYHKFCSCVKAVFTYCRAEFGVKVTNSGQYGRITPDMVKSFCAVLSDKGYARNTVNGYITQIEKFGLFTGQGKVFQTAMKEFRDTDSFKGLENKDTQTRAYADPSGIIDALKQVSASEQTISKAQFSATLELKYGLRTNDACHFKIVGDKILFNSKNGMKTTKALAPEDLARAKELSANGKYDFSINTLKDVWAKACASVGVANNGQHGLRHNFAQSLYSELRSRGLSHNQARLIVSKEMGHKRPEITDKYLR